MVSKVTIVGDTNIPGFSSMLQHPIITGHGNFPFLPIHHFSVNERDARSTRVVHIAGTMPCDVLIAVVRFTWQRKTVFWHRQLAFHVASLASVLSMVVVNHLLASYHDLGPEFSEYGT